MLPLVGLWCCRGSFTSQSLHLSLRAGHKELFRHSQEQRGTRARACWIAHSRIYLQRNISPLSKLFFFLLQGIYSSSFPSPRQALRCGITFCLPIVAFQWWESNILESRWPPSAVPCVMRGAELSVAASITAGDVHPQVDKTLPFSH